MNLHEIWKQRSELDEFKMRDAAYQIYEAAFLGRSTDKKKQYLTWRPQMLDGGSMTADSGEDKALVNLCRQINTHHQASFARPPRIWSVPYSPESIKDSDLKSAIIQGVLRRSRIKSLQPLQAWRLSNRGDALMGVEWSPPDQSPMIQVRTYDPAYCYPSLDKDDMGAMHDLLVTYEVRKEWAERTFNVSIGGQKPHARVFIYWTPEKRLVSVEQTEIKNWTLDHKLGFVPWRWIYNQDNGFMAQSDIAEIPKLQQLLSDMVQLSMDAARKRVDKAYWGKGISGDVIPQPGKVVAFPNPNAQISEFPTADPPEMLGPLMQMIQQYAQGMGGISPISMEGMAQGSIVTGSAIRHQIEAIEARTETKRVVLEDSFGILGEYILKVLEHQFPENELVVQTEKGEAKLKGVEVKSWYACQASYGGFEGMGPTERGRWALEGLGRLHGRKKAIAIAYPEEDVAAMNQEVQEFQLEEATTTARAQAVAQQIAQQGAGGPAAGGSPPGSPTGSLPGAPQAPPIQMNTPPQPPGMPQMAQAAGRQVVKLGELTSLVDVVRPRLKGEVWAVGEIAVAGQSASPRVMVRLKDDEPPVTAALKQKNVTVTVGTPGKDEPKMTL